MATLSTSQFRKGFCTFLCIVVATSLSAQSILQAHLADGHRVSTELRALVSQSPALQGNTGLIGLTT